MHSIYVAGAYRADTQEAIARNIESAGRLGANVCTLGWFPIIPYMNTANLEVGQPDLDETAQAEERRLPAVRASG